MATIAAEERTRLNDIGTCVLVAWACAPDSWGATVGWVVHQSAESIVLTCCSGTHVPHQYTALMTIAAEHVQEIRVLMFAEEVREYYRPAGA